MADLSSEIYSAIVSAEKKIKELRDSPDLAKNLNLFNELLNDTKQKYHELIILYPGYSIAKKDLLGQMWKSCFYKQIEDYRKALKIMKQKYESIRPRHPELTKKLAHLTNSFQDFLNTSIQYFQNFKMEMQDKSKLVSPKNSELSDFFYNGMYRCLLYLGDLARYKQLYSENDQKDFTESVRYYEKASLMCPESGNAHNQLAMLATYNEAESTALYHYCRSIMTSQPFSGGFENIAKLFSMNKSSFEKLQSEAKQLDDFNSRKHETIRFKFFLTSLVRLYGIYFGWIIRMHLDYLKSTLSQSSQSSLESITLLEHLNGSLDYIPLPAHEKLNIGQLQEKSASLLELFDSLLSYPKLSDIHLLRVIVISIFFIHFSEKTDSGILSDPNMSAFLHSSSASQNESEEPSLPKHRTIIQSLVLSTTFGLISKAILKLSSNENFDLNKRTPYDKFLPMLSIFSEWLSNHSSYFNNPQELYIPDSSDNLALPAVFADTNEASLRESEWLKTYCASKDLILNESRIRSSMRSAFKFLMEKDVMKQFSSLSPKSPANLLVREFAEMKGFLPLGDSLVIHFQKFDPSSENIQWMPEAEAKKTRIKSIQKLLVLFEDKSQPEQKLFEGYITSKSSNQNAKEMASKNQKSKSRKRSSDKEKVSEKLSKTQAPADQFPALPGQGSTKDQSIKPSEITSFAKVVSQTNIEDIIDGEEDNDYMENDILAETESDLNLSTFDQPDCILDDLDDVVFQPALNRISSPFPSAHNTSFISRASSGIFAPTINEELVADSILMSLGLGQSKNSNPNLADPLLPSEAIGNNDFSFLEKIYGNDLNSNGASNGFSKDWNMEFFGSHPLSNINNNPLQSSIPLSSNPLNADWNSYPSFPSTFSQPPPPPGLSNTPPPIIPPGLVVSTAASNNRTGSSFLDYLDETKDPQYFPNS